MDEPSTGLLERARAGDGEAFAELVEPYRRELRVHCYRMLGSVQDAEDVLQETLVAAWRGLDGYQGRSSMRTWLYKIATNRCLNALRADARRPEPASSEVEFPVPTRWVEPSLLEPYPDALLESREAISLAFVAAMQALPPRQRAVLVLRDVLGFRASETAAILGVTEESVTSALKRARAAMPVTASRPPASRRERELAGRFAEAFESGDVHAIVELLTDDAWLRMPPLPLEYQGRDAAANFLRTISFRGTRRYRLVPTRANGQPAFGCYLYDDRTATARAHGLLLITITDDGITELTRFLDNSVLPAFGLPRTLRD
jgi:RNA polymerase sigma-70 factor (ECF subfamily)